MFRVSSAVDAPAAVLVVDGRPLQPAPAPPAPVSVVGAAALGVTLSPLRPSPSAALGLRLWLRARVPNSVAPLDLVRPALPLPLLGHLARLPGVAVRPRVEQRGRGDHQLGVGVVCGKGVA